MIKILKILAKMVESVLTVRAPTPADVLVAGQGDIVLKVSRLVREITILS